jgi:hypothetical protein
MEPSKPETHEAAASKSSETKHASNNAPQSAETLRQVMDILQPMIEFHHATEALTRDDVKIVWNVRAIRGEDEAIIHLQGSSSLPNMLASNRVAQAPLKMEEEIVDKIAAPLTTALQTQVD